MKRVLSVSALVAASLTVFACPAMAAGLSNVSALPLNETAGAHSDFTVSFDVDDLGDEVTGDDIKDLDLELPAGFLGDPGAADVCSFADLQADSCPTTSRVGRVAARASALQDPTPPGGNPDDYLNASLANIRIPGDVYIIPVRGTEAARLGIVLRPIVCRNADALAVTPCTESILDVPLDNVILESAARVRTASDGGLTAEIRGIPKVQIIGETFAELSVNQMVIKLLRTSGAGRTFTTNPTTCGTATTRLVGTTYAGAELTGSASYESIGCADVPFEPGLQFSSDAAGSDLPTAASVTVTLPFNRDDPDVLAQSQPKTAVVALPKGFELSPTIGSAGNLAGCTDEQFARGSSAPSSCPAGSQVGTVEFSSPLLPDPIPGKVFLAQPAPGQPLIRIFIVAEQSGAVDALRIKLAGASEPDLQTGQVVTTLTDIPPLPFTTFKLNFTGGQHAVFASPRDCGTYTSAAVFSPHSGTSPATPSTTTEVSGDCPDKSIFTPGILVTTSPSLAGSDAPIVTTIERPDRQARLDSLKLSLPAGLLGRIPGIPQCAVADAQASNCPAASRVGTVTALAGAGPAPLSVSGPVYLTPSIDGSFAGLAIIVPAAVGPLDLGNTVTIARLLVRPADQGLDVVANGIPQRQKGVALSIRSLKLALDRPGFTFNATSCAQQPVSATFGSDLGGSASTLSSYQATGCAALPFAPNIAATLTGARKDVGIDGHPGLTVAVTQTPGQSNMRSVKVALPEGIATDPTQASQACAVAAFAANACPEASVVGSARAVTSLLEQQIAGKVYFVVAAGGGLPELKVQLRGQIPVDLTGKVTISPKGQLVTEFGGIPDVPIANFELKLKGGKVGLLTASRDMCTSAPAIDAAFSSYSGASLPKKIAVGVENCTPTATVRLSSLRRGQPALRLRVNGARTKVTKLRLKLPSGLTLDTKRARSLTRVQAVGLKKGTRATVKVTGTRVDVTLPKGGASRVTVTLRTRSLKVTRRLRLRSNPRLTFGLELSRPKLKVLRSNLRTRPVARL